MAVACGRKERRGLIGTDSCYELLKRIGDRKQKVKITKKAASNKKGERG